MIGLPFPWLGLLGTTPDEPRPRADETYAGDRTVEAQVVAEVASFGKQLGILAEAVLEIADERQGAGVERLRSIVTRVETIKAHHARSLEDRAEEAFGALAAADPAAASRLLSSLERRLIPPESEPADRDDAAA
ncbi:hypothetical protein [Oharaeibacter diazotrophicus]|uniref:Uncharacterized protein n=1 Tax=Oharaeibacter diazotrophicus TaxID=1920512 RepID=A0A4R6RJQ3_9HYPH|nr:hypothetical protein [Oharaeibacter diazotrophicus]TDP86652.1 hypothetical protein EDD54_0531 [Oharaeibacter diazotrophicus]BBE71407.1 hypothetical protein OHA_1_00981 [Pleomorphomonas sp. SM30]GLS78164.1 hypothetical protein GCM10007904_35010 [Oharaeibacter diazotrophicus]